MSLGYSDSICLVPPFNPLSFSFLIICFFFILVFIENFIIKWILRCNFSPLILPTPHFCLLLIGPFCSWLHWPLPGFLCSSLVCILHLDSDFAVRFSSFLIYSLGRFVWTLLALALASFTCILLGSASVGGECCFGLFYFSIFGFTL